MGGRRTPATRRAARGVEIEGDGAEDVGESTAAEGGRSAEAKVDKAIPSASLLTSADPSAASGSGTSEEGDVPAIGGARECVVPEGVVLTPRL